MLVEGRGTWMFVRCIMKLHACIKFLSYLLSINYFMFVSFVVFGCYTADDNGGKCVYMFMTWCSLPWNTTNTGKNMLCYGRPFYPFSMNISVWYFKSSVSWAWKVTNHRSFVFQACWYLTTPFRQHTYQSVIAFFNEWSKYPSTMYHFVRFW